MDKRSILQVKELYRINFKVNLGPEIIQGIYNGITFPHPNTFTFIWAFGIKAVVNNLSCPNCKMVSPIEASLDNMTCSNCMEGYMFDKSIIPDYPLDV